MTDGAATGSPTPPAGHPETDGTRSSRGQTVAMDDAQSSRGDAVTTDVTLSVVVVTRNEADRIADCIESAFEITAGIADVDVVVVDSNSDDGTADIASEYPVTVLRIPDDDLCSCGAGRHVGLEHTDGDYVLFVDGDMILQRGWLETALGVLQRHDDVAGVDGWLTDRRGTPGEANYLRGVVLYERAPLDDIDGFDPRIKGLSDVDVGMRLRRAGYTLRRLPVVVADHPSSEGVGERIRRWNEGYYASNGQVLRKTAGQPALFARWLYRLRFFLSIAVWLAVGALVAASGRRDAKAMWAAGSAAGVTGLAVKKGVRWTALKLTLRFGLVVLGVGVGFLQGPTPRTYPIDRVEVVSRPETNDPLTLEHDD